MVQTSTNKIQAHADTHPVAVFVLGGGLCLQGLAPGLVSAYLEMTGLTQWLRPLWTPSRLQIGPAFIYDRSTRPGRLVLASEGHDLHWLVDTAGEVASEVVSRTMTLALGGTVVARPVSAWDPASST